TGSIPQDGRLATRVQNHRIYKTVIIEVVERGAPTAQLGEQPIATLGGDIDEFPLACIALDDIASLVTGRIIEILHVIDEMPASDKNVAIAVAVEVHDPRAPSDVRVGAVSCTGVA